MVINQSGLIDHHMKEPGEKGRIRVENINELISAVKSFEALNKHEDMSEYGSYISAFLSSKEIMNHFKPGSHGSTFGGNPLASKVASKALDLLFEEKLIENSKTMGDYFLSKLKDIDSKIIKEVRGKGLWIGMELNNAEVNAKNLCMMLLNEGLLCKETHETVIRFAPPLMIGKKDIDWALNKITKVITSIE